MMTQPPCAAGARHALTVQAVPALFVPVVATGLKSSLFELTSLYAVENIYYFIFLNFEESAS
jgi:hypothetical protein